MPQLTVGPFLRAGKISWIYLMLRQLPAYCQIYMRISRNSDELNHTGGNAPTFRIVHYDRTLSAK